jgi:hypothetical protein
MSPHEASQKHVTSPLIPGSRSGARRTCLFKGNGDSSPSNTAPKFLQVAASKQTRRGKSRQEGYSKGIINPSDTADPILSQRFWYREPYPLSTILVPRTLTSLNVSGTADPILSQCFWFRGPYTLSTFLVVRTLTSLNVSGSADPILSQPFWYRGPYPLSTFLVPRTLSSLNHSGTADPNLSQRFWFRGPCTVSTSLVPRTPPQNYLIHIIKYNTD